jgi:hypothetical protein
MKTHVRILYAVAVVALVAGGLALKSQNDQRAATLASAAHAGGAAATGSTR